MCGCPPTTTSGGPCGPTASTKSLITGDADPYDKFAAFAGTVPHTLRNPLYIWSHLELRRYFGIDLLLNEDTAREIWDEANRQLMPP